MRFLHFSYLATAGAAPLRPHELRDGNAFVELSHALVKLGHDYGGLVINYPQKAGQADSSLMGIRGLSTKDFLVLTTRPPLNDRPLTGTPKPLERSGSVLEHSIFYSMRKHISKCTRDEIQLNHSEHLEERFMNRADVAYYIKTDKNHPRFEAAYHARVNDKGRFADFDPNLTTAAYLLHAEPIVLPNGRKGPRVLAAFGVSGTIGLIFAYLLRTQPFPPFVGLLEQVLMRPSIMMLEITVTGPNPVAHPFRDLRFANHWKYQLLTKAVQVDK